MLIQLITFLLIIYYSLNNIFFFLGIEAFSKVNISETILRRLLKQDIVYHIKKNKDWRNDPGCVIYQRGKPVDFFVLVLEGRVEVTIGQENLVFESGPFTYFGTQALAQNVGVGMYGFFVLFLQVLNKCKTGNVAPSWNIEVKSKAKV